MTNPIQTPLIRGKFYKELSWQYFTVQSDSLAPIMWRGYDLQCLPVRSFSQFTTKDLLVLECRVAGRKRTTYQVGFFHFINSQTFTLDYITPKLKKTFPNWQIPMRQIKRVWIVDSVIRDYAHMNRFYPYRSYGRY